MRTLGIRFDNPEGGPEIKDMIVAQIIVQMSAAGAQEGFLDLDVKRTSGKSEHWRISFKRMRKAVKHGPEAKDAG